MLVEFAEAGDRSDNVGALVHDDDGRRAQTRLDVSQGVEIHQYRVAGAFGENRDRGTTRNDGQQIVPATTDTATMSLDEIAKRDTHLLLNRTWIVDVSRNAKQLGARVVLTP